MCWQCPPQRCVLCSYISASKVVIKSVSPQVGLSPNFRLYTSEMKWIPPSKTCLIHSKKKSGKVRYFVHLQCSSTLNTDCCWIFINCIVFDCIRVSVIMKLF